MREVERLGELNLEKMTDEAYENEIFLVESCLGLPNNFMKLSFEEQSMLMLYTDGEIVEPFSGKKTKGNILASYLMIYPNKKVLERIFITKKVITGIDGSGNEIFEERKEIDSNMFSQYLQIKASAGALWKKNNLKDLVKVVRELIEYGGLKDEDILERTILDDAMSGDRSNFTARMRSIAVKIKGMEKSNQLQQVNVYVEGGGKQLNKIIAESSGNNNYDLGIIECEIDDNE